MSTEEVESNCGVVITPSKKRKRDFDAGLQFVSSGFTNGGFSSTPNKEAKLLIETFNKFPQRRYQPSQTALPSGISYLEEKSIADIAKENESAGNQNPFEIVRKPPKKKKKPDIENACFVNPALNLNGPENKFNPFEVKRTPIAASTKDTKCFVNAALNIRMPESDALINPFEIARVCSPKPVQNGIENPALEIPTPLSIAIPFQPTIGCRIDFSKMSVEGLTPSKLLSEKLVFTPPSYKPRKSFNQPLSVINEETVDIGKELDHYQLELENSINEAKIRKEKGIAIPKICDIEEETTKTKLTEGVSNDSTDMDSRDNSVKVEIENIDDVETPKMETNKVIEVLENNTSIEEISKEEEIDLPAPKPFVRSYRGKENKPCVQKIPLQEENIPNPPAVDNKTTRMGESIRKSIRKFIHLKNDKILENKKKKSQGSHHIFGMLRQSMRRKCRNEQKIVEEKSPVNETSLIDDVKRSVFRSASLEDNLNPADGEKKSFLRTSIRKSTRSVRNQVLKNVFKKQLEEYEMVE